MRLSCPIEGRFPDGGVSPMMAVGTSENSARRIGIGYGRRFALCGTKSECKFMKTRELSLLASLVAASFAAGCATTEKTASAPPDSMNKTADAVIYVSGLA